MVHQSSCPASMQDSSQIEPKQTRLQTLIALKRCSESCCPYIHTHIFNNCELHDSCHDAYVYIDNSNIELQTKFTLFMLHKIQYFPKFLQNRRKEAELKKREKEKQKEMQPVPVRAKETSFYSQDFQAEKTVSNDDVVTNGKLLRVKAPTLIETEFRVVCLYAQEQTEVIASRQEIIEKNIGALLDYYQNTMNLKDKIVITPT